MPAPVQHPQSCLAYALAYARRGWPVFPLHTPTRDGCCSCGKPCGNPGKHPRTKHGLKEATTDEQIIRRWWATWPDANVGVVTGERSELLVFDIDPRHGGQATWTAIVTDHDEWPLTVSVATGGGGSHVWFRRPKDRGTVRSRANVIKPGVDTRCDGGYVVAPPSLHTSGKRYEFRPGAQPGEADLQECPAWLLDLISTQPGPVSRKRPVTQSSTDDGWLLTAFKAAGWARREMGPDRWAVVCPWESSHTTPAGENDSSTVVFRPSAGKTMGWFHCSHGHCADRKIDDARASLPAEAIAAADAAYPRTVQPPAKQADPDPVTGEVACDDWQSELSRKASGELNPTHANVIAILSHDPAWQGVLGHDLFAGRSVFRKPPPWYDEDSPAEAHTDLDDQDDIRIVSWLERRYAFRIGRETVHAAAEIVCQRNAHHPVREYLAALVWDGVQRLPAFATTYLGAADDAHYRSAPLRWFIAAVRRVSEPGCQCDSILVLEGDQGIGKSRLLRCLAGHQWFADEIGDPSNKDAADALRGKWIIEIGELRWRKSDDDTRKAFISRPTDHYRPAYGRRSVDIPRQCVIAASTNEHDWQTDPTGARRYWAIRCVRIDFAALSRDRDQLWAEAVVRYQGGEPSWLQDDEVPAQAKALEERRETDPWEDQIRDWIAVRSSVTVADILGNCVGIELGKRTQNDSRRVGRVLRAAGWEVVAMLGARGSRVKTWGPRKP